MEATARVLLVQRTPARGVSAAAFEHTSVEALFRAEGKRLVSLARIFVDDRNAAEDIVQEAFIRFERARHRIADTTRAPAYLRSIVLNLARDSNRRGLVSLRHLPALLPVEPPGPLDQVVRNQEHRDLLEALRDLPRRQRDCLVLRWYLELDLAQIAETLSISVNSVKTHLQRGLAKLRSRLEQTE